MSGQGGFATLFMKAVRNERTGSKHQDVRALHEAAPALDGWHDLRREIDRARRFDRPFVLVGIDIRGARDDLVAFGRALGAAVRSIDRVWAAEGRVYLVLPESDREAGERLIARLRRELPALVPEGAAALAAFPEDGLTSGALLAQLAEDRYEPVERPERVGGTVPFDSVAHAHSR